jgi:hypothetical protein
MIQTLEDLTAATAFERSVIDTIYPIVEVQQARRTLDLRQNVVTLPMQAAMVTTTRDRLIHQLRPLFFGAAWKVLDLIVEYGLNRSGASKTEWRISEKQASVRALRLPPFDVDVDVWARLAALYSGLVEARHCLIHREFTMTSASDITGLRDRKGNPVPDVTAAEQNAFCRAVQRTFISVRRTRFDARDRLDMIASLDQLGQQHQHPVLGGGAADRLPALIITDARREGAKWKADTREALARARRSWPGEPYFDIEVRFSDAGIAPLRGRLDDAPITAEVFIDPSQPPDWLDS